MTRCYDQKKYENYLAFTIGCAIFFKYTSVYAEETFNPAFISSDIASVANLSQFAQGNAQPEGIYKVDIYLNNEYLTTQSMAFSQKVKNDSEVNANADDTGLEPCLTKEKLEAFNLNSKVIPILNEVYSSECLNLPKIIPEASVRFDFEQQRLYFSIPQAALIHTARGYVPQEQWDEGISAFLLDYNFTGSHSENYLNNNSLKSNNYYARLNSGFNIGAWRIRNESSFVSNQNGDTNVADWNNISTYAQRGLNTLKSTLTLGDSYTSGEVFDSIGIRGIQLKSNEEMLPESQRGFAPTIHGIANSHATVILRQNGYIIYQANVAPGPFVINDLYQTASSGDIQVSIEEADGKVNQFVVPYSAIPILQREGQFKYSLTAAEFRSGHINKNQPKFIQATASLGLKSDLGLTLYGGTQLAKDYQSLLLGGGMNLGQWGAVSADVTHAESTLADDRHHRGQSLRFLYAKSLNNLGTNVQLLGYRYSTKGFYTFDESTYTKMNSALNDQSSNNLSSSSFLTGYDLNHTKKGRIQATLSQQIGRLGSVYLSGNRQSYWNTDKTTESIQLGLSWSGKIASYNAGYSFSKSPWLENDHGFSFGISLPLDKLFKKKNPAAPYTEIGNTAYASYAVTSDRQGNVNQQLALTGTLLKNNNLSYNISRSFNQHQQNHSSNVGINWQTRYGRLDVGYYYSPAERRLNYGLSGGLLLHRNGVTLGQSLGSTNVLVKAPEAKHAAIENTTGIRTDRRGYAIVPYASAYRRNRVAIQTTSLENHIEIDETVKNVVPTQGAVVLANYSVRIGVRALLTLLKADGKPVPFGAKVSIVGGNGQSAIVGDLGQVYLAGLALNGTLHASWGEQANEQCQFDYQLPPDSQTRSISHLQVECN
ncbi:MULTISPECIES: fimbria/pilus outer membrane usher protein [unclassified Acinetobacter]|uniref:fimbria/pilus outer membrane usher protein n=1 Tax=unclassified Acinetobacter TaxID=196816 RepID=UPI002934916C|nr:MULTISPECIES: fimbria/pilus outer membrane usher protein [unclassified Acinetobacter]WOE33014.1 fimbria/pilus outer membrane usher protein [Acinetobacter sp. SAAs470]WOE38492.1 fimbria/pilus outer membrane usher protein [Acinetobacter sp. SAAs474]